MWYINSKRIVNFCNKNFYFNCISNVLQCKNCKNYICSNCKKNHDVKYYSHILANPHKFGEDEKIEDTKNHRRYASVGTRNIKRVKKAQEERHKCPRLERLETRKNFCVNCKKTDKKLNMCRKCNKYYCLFPDLIIEY